MRNFIFVLSALIITLSILTGCGDSVPECSESDVKGLVIDIATGEMQKILFYQSIVSELGTSPQVYGNPSYTEWKSKANENESIKKVIDATDLKMNKVKMELADIRTEMIDKDAKKCKCAANLNVTGKQVPITYTAQRGDNGDLFANVFGL